MVKLRYINHYSVDNQRLIQFYQNIIGLRADQPNGSWYSFTASEVQLAVEPEANRVNNQQKYDANWHSPYLLQIEVASETEMREILERAKANNITILAEFEKTHFGTLSKLLDPDGNMLELILE